MVGDYSTGVYSRIAVEARYVQLYIGGDRAEICIQNTIDCEVLNIALISTLEISKPHLVKCHIGAVFKRWYIMEHTCTCGQQLTVREGNVGLVNIRETLHGYTTFYGGITIGRIKVFCTEVSHGALTIAAYFCDDVRQFFKLRSEVGDIAHVHYSIFKMAHHHYAVYIFRKVGEALIVHCIVVLYLTIICFQVQVGTYRRYR